MTSKQFFYNFGKAIYHIDAFYAEYAKKSNVSPALLWILYALNDGNPHTQIEISTDWALPKTTINTVIKEIEEKGFIDLVPIKGKRREMTVVLTKSGKEYADTLLSDLYKIEKTVFKKLSEEEMKAAESLEKICDGLIESQTFGLLTEF